MIGFFASLLLKAGLFKGSMDVARRAAGIGLVVVLVLAIAGGGCLWIRAHDRAVLEEAALEQKAAAAERDLRGERAAGTVAGAAADAFAASQAALKESTDEALRNDPEGAARPVGPGMQSYFDRLREERRAAGGAAAGGAPGVQERAGDPASR